MAIIDEAAEVGVVGRRDLLPLLFMARSREAMPTFSDAQDSQGLDQLRSMMAERRHFVCDRGGADDEPPSGPLQRLR